MPGRHPDKLSMMVTFPLVHLLPDVEDVSKADLLCVDSRDIMNVNSSRRLYPCGNMSDGDQAGITTGLSGSPDRRRGGGHRQQAGAKRLENRRLIFVNNNVILLKMFCLSMSYVNGGRHGQQTKTF